MIQKANLFKRLIVRSKNKPAKLLRYGIYLGDFAKNFLLKTDAEGYIVGLSGGIDSALAVAILSQVPDFKTVAVFIDIESNPQDRADAELLKSKFKFEYKYLNLTDEYHSLVKKLDIRNEISKNNLKVRLRMAALYGIANANNLLVCGTTNADERLVGYYTKFGDGACDVALLNYLTKSQVRYLSKEIGVPDKLIAKKPSAGLYEGQTDEKDLGVTYDEIDHYLSFAVIDPMQDSKITGKYIRNKHKLTSPAKPKKFMPLRNVK